MQSIGPLVEYAVFACAPMLYFSASLSRSARKV